MSIMETILMYKQIQTVRRNKGTPSSLEYWESMINKYTLEFYGKEAKELLDTWKAMLLQINFHWKADIEQFISHLVSKIDSFRASQIDNAFNEFQNETAQLKNQSEVVKSQSETPKAQGEMLRTPNEMPRTEDELPKAQYEIQREHSDIQGAHHGIPESKCNIQKMECETERIQSRRNDMQAQNDLPENSANNMSNAQEMLLMNNSEQANEMLKMNNEALNNDIQMNLIPKVSNMIDILRPVNPSNEMQDMINNKISLIDHMSDISNNIEMNNVIKNLRVSDGIRMNKMNEAIEKNNNVHMNCILNKENPISEKKNVLESNRTPIGKYNAVLEVRLPICPEEIFLDPREIDLSLLKRRGKGIKGVEEQLISEHLKIFIDQQQKVEMAKWIIIIRDFKEISRKMYDSREYGGRKQLEKYIEVYEKLKGIAEKYGKDFDEVCKIFGQVCGSLNLTEEYLKGGQVNLWNELEDLALNHQEGGR